MYVAEDFVHAIGRTPLIKLGYPSKLTGCNILAKAEFMNPSQSVKDRAALGILTQAMKKGEISRGGTIVEGTAGNTGIGLTLVGNALGLKSVIVIPNNQSREKMDTLRLIGAEVVEVPPVPYKDPNNFVRYAGRLAKRLSESGSHGVIWANQFDNLANREIHAATTAAEIWEQTQGKVDGFICAVGTGGTLAGVSMALKERNPDVLIGLVDPLGASLYNFYRNGELKAEGSSIIEGIGQGRITGNLQDAKIDFAYRCTDTMALTCLVRLMSTEGLCLGGSSGINVVGATYFARELGPGHTVVTVLGDLGTRYNSTLYNPEYLESKGIMVPDWLSRRSDELPEVFVEA